MKVGIEALFTSAQGLQSPWVVADVQLDTAQRRMEVETDPQTGKAFAIDLETHGDKCTATIQTCMDMSAAFLKGSPLPPPNALVSSDGFPVGARANEAMDVGRAAGWRNEAAKGRQALGQLGPKMRRLILWRMRRNPSGKSSTPAEAFETKRHGGRVPAVARAREPS